METSAPPSNMDARKVKDEFKPGIRIIIGHALFVYLAQVASYQKHFLLYKLQPTFYINTEVILVALLSNRSDNAFHQTDKQPVDPLIVFLWVTVNKCNKMQATFSNPTPELVVPNATLFNGFLPKTLLLEKGTGRKKNGNDNNSTDTNFNSDNLTKFIRF